MKSEIQLRTSCQNGWAMKTRELTYIRKSDLSKEISNQMKILSDSLSEVDSKMSISLEDANILVKKY